MGWEPTETTVYEYDADGRLIRSVTTRDSAWTRGQVNLHLAAAAIESDIGPHGLPLSETTSEFACAYGAVGKRYKYHYEARGPFQDSASVALAQAEAAYKKSNPDKDMAGLFWVPERVERG